MKRFVAIWFPYLLADRQVRRNPELKELPFVMAAPERGRMVIRAVNKVSQHSGIYPGMVVADAKAILPALKVFEDEPGMAENILTAIAEWCIRYTPVAAVDLPDSIVLDATGCTHLWGSETAYVKDIYKRFDNLGYHVCIAIAGTIAAAWALAHYGKNFTIAVPGNQSEALLALPPAALRLDGSTLQRMDKLGLHHIAQLMPMQRSALRRRFGDALLLRLDQAFGHVTEHITPVCPIQPYMEHLPCAEPVCTLKAIEIAAEKLLDRLSKRLDKEQTGLRSGTFRCYRVDGNIQQIVIGTNRPSRNVSHLFKLLSLKLGILEPRLGFELFVFEAPVVEPLSAEQEALWDDTASHDDMAIAELLDRISGKIGTDTVHRYLPAEHYLPEHAYRKAISLDEPLTTAWRTDLPRPVNLLHRPEAIEVTVRLPDYPPMLFHYKGVLHRITQADGPERIEQEWWIAEGQYRDYYIVEDEQGLRYWIFRLGHYKNHEPKWFLHGFFA